ncbi:amidohydrolase family protein [Microbacterium paraoxydans]|uniref:Amidohydrolase family protein n=1 Tax=Microbacterium paraoxydans TaxID=199592 RepID=A0ABS5ILQ6_9MICO|nr:amidohydrolase family protein [Microbacterium paraoxydans]MBS0023894.1 amidohydrolase family protein [Microbacterium paraoxydans]
MRLLDSHLHLWDPRALEYTWLEGPLDRRFADDELAAARVDRATEERAVFVQAETVEGDYLAEVRWVAERAERLGVVGIVAGARLDRGTDTTVHLESLTAEPLVVGVRHNLQSEPDGVALSSAFITGAREVAAHGWTFDACVRADQLPDVARISSAIPELRIVLDHLGKPPVGTAASPLAPTVEWERDLAELARHPGAFCKVSGLPAEAGGDWSAAQLEPFLDAAADVFGPERLMWGSDWPVSAVGPEASGASATVHPSARSRWAEAVAAWAESRGIDRDALFHGTAATFYGL